MEEYEWFLEITTRPDILEWISDNSNRSEAYQRAKQYGDKMYTLLALSAQDNDTLRYLTI
jgi:hypothetical protein